MLFIRPKKYSRQNLSPKNIPLEISYPKKARVANFKPQKGFAPPC